MDYIVHVYAVVRVPIKVKSTSYDRAAAKVIDQINTGDVDFPRLITAWGIYTDDFGSFVTVDRVDGGGKVIESRTVDITS